VVFSIALGMLHQLAFFYHAVFQHHPTRSYIFGVVRRMYFIQFQRFKPETQQRRQRLGG
jgi:hypothetical protein